MRQFVITWNIRKTKKRGSNTAGKSTDMLRDACLAGRRVDDHSLKSFGGWCLGASAAIVLGVAFVDPSVAVGSDCSPALRYWQYGGRE